MATIKSIEEKARRYDKALERANKLKETCDSNAVVGWMEYIFPELKESGDIRKRIIDALHGDVLEMGEIKKAIAWLEKQGNLMKALQISNAKIGELIEKNYYLKEQLEKQGKNNMGISETTKKELEDNLNKALEKETPESWNKFLEKQGSKKETLKERNICDTCEDSNGCLIPCCAKLLEKQGEQKPTIEMKTPEESLDIDSDTYNKIVDECVYGEQNPAWSEEDEMHIRELESLVKQVWATVEHENDKDTIHKMSDLLFFLKTLKPQPKQEWSEEDNRMCKAIIDNIQAICEEGYFVGNIDSDELIKWLKSLKEKYTWKPSDMQMKALEHFVRSIGESGYASPYDNDTKLLYSLLFDLKKLREK